MFEHPNHKSYPHYNAPTEQVQKKFSTPMLVVKNNELVVDQAVRR